MNRNTDLPNARPFDIDLAELRQAIQHEYMAVAEQPERGFHFHTGRTQLAILEYDEALLEDIPEQAIASAAGTGNPFSLGRLQPGQRVVDIGSGSGLDSFIAGRMVAPGGRVIGVDMTDAMLERARAALEDYDYDTVTFRKGYGESLPVPDAWADAVISNGVLNLMPDKPAALQEMARVLKPGGRLQIADITVDREVPESARQNIDLWTG